MEVSKNSWHYSIVDSVFSDPSKSLCTYFWQIVGSILLYVVMAAVAIAGISLLAMGVFSVFFAIWALSTHGLEYATADGYEYIYFVAGGVMILFFSSVACIWVALKYTFTKISNIETKPNIATEYIKAKKEKVCPRITFK